MVDLLLVEDNLELADLICTFLKKDGFSIINVDSGEKALEFLEKEAFKIVILDIMLPGIDGFTVCSSIRKNHNTPIIIMSAKVDKEDKINGFTLGADDYIEKPVDVDILSAKISALMKRNYELKAKRTIINSGAISINKEANEVYLNGKLLNVTSKEFELLLLLVENPGKTLRKDYIFNKIWGADSFSEDQTLTVHIKMLRDKIEDNPKKPKRIVTLWGVGYKYEEI
ncbi:sensory transduction protein regX3 [Clostridium homopropionicum DSM 5847]|uniref:Stage 0 sporulation protein A homolog n=1 Tax=Clostridium homopropionicum DSM 5847 TaxID=1121318 RepID=A0A0L6ZBJ5_9CLOT|nr:response regulator transcription factor [Clostridium homopropionicum]KOA20336.1 sensory transduction protein regX3 [Clostridium homopropionicum DSM 5847]SFG94001.1 DNA-binding response regulator, OmpR family, contains REC and winged-helix (wHTH) domain [Clostridium homopropionicum]